MSIISSTVKIYDANQTLVETLPVIGDAKETTSTNLSPGTQYYATVESVDDQQQSSGESAPYQFYSLPNVNFIGYVTRDATGFVRQMNNTTTDVRVIENGIVWDTSSSFTNPTYTSGTMVTGLTENTTYYYRPYCIDEFNRRWVNTNNTESVTTTFAVPTINWVSIYGADVSTFSALINVTSIANISAVVAEITTGGVTTTQTLTAQTGNQYVTITGLTPNTTYDITIRATNSAGNGYSSSESFTTLEAAAGMTITLVRPEVSNEDNEFEVTSVASYNPGEITLVSNSVELYQNEYHTGIPVDTDTDTTDSLTSTFTGLSVDTTYWVFGKVTYTVGSDPTVVTAWSEPYEIHTYTLMSFGTITTTTDGASIPFSVQGTATQVEVMYSIDGMNWIPIPVNDPTGETLSVTGLASGTTYYVQGRAESQAGWQEYVTDSFTTIAVTPSITITNVSNVTSSSAQVNVQINQ